MNVWDTLFSARCVSARTYPGPIKPLTWPFPIAGYFPDKLNGIQHWFAYPHWLLSRTPVLRKKLVSMLQPLAVMATVGWTAVAAPCRRTMAHTSLATYRKRAKGVTGWVYRYPRQHQTGKTDFPGAYLNFRSTAPAKSAADKIPRERNNRSTCIRATIFLGRMNHPVI